MESRERMSAGVSSLDQNLRKRRKFIWQVAAVGCSNVAKLCLRHPSPFVLGGTHWVASAS